MKITRSLSRMIMIAVLALAGCRGGVSPQAGTPQPSAAATGAAGQGGNPLPGGSAGGTAAPTMRATSPALPALSGDFAAFDGLYWTDEVGVEPAGENAVRLVSGLPCASLLDLLSAGEWRLVERADPRPEQVGLVASLALLEKGDQSALVELKDMNVAALVVEGAPTPTPLPQDAPKIEGCAGTLQVLPVQPVHAVGEQEAEGQALQYPMGNGCLRFKESVTASLFYEGPGDLRAVLEFSVPEAVGEYTVEEADLSLELLRSDQRLVGMFATMYARGFEPGDSQLGSEYYPDSENAGTVRVTSLDPLAGEIDLTGYAGEEGPQTFKAGFRCEVVR